ncbi:glycosyltransferase [Bacteroidota bacterium]
MLRRILIKLSDAAIFYGNNPAHVFSRFIDPKKLFVAPNSLDTIKLREHYKELKEIGIVQIKNDLNNKSRYNLIYLARLLPSKLPDLLPEIVLKLGKYINLEDFMFHIIGDGPEKKILQEKIKTLSLENYFTMHGAVYDNASIGRQLFISDMIVNPGRLGLSLCHGFCYNIPTITFISDNEGPYHAPETEFLTNESTGFTIDDFNIEAMAKQISTYLTDEHLREIIRQNITQLIDEKYNVKEMIKGFKSAIEYTVLKDDR